MTALYNHESCDCEVCLGDDFEPEKDINVTNGVKSALKKIYTGSYSGAFPTELWEITANALSEAVDTEFGDEFKPLKNQLKYQNRVFAAFKSANQTQTLERLKMASKAKTFADFEAEVKSVTDEYNIHHLKAEYNTALKAVRSAKRWAQAVQDADLFPNIEYLESTAKDPRDNHKPYYGMIRPMDDPILDSILPPSDWGCQCGWRTTDKDPTPIPKDTPKAEPGLDNNPGKTGAAFSETHPHYKRAKNAESIIRQNITEIYGVPDEEITEFYYNPKSKGCYFSVVKLAKSEKVANKRIAKVFADKGHLVELYDSDGLDAMVDNRWNEFKTPSNTFNAFDKRMQKAFKQFRDNEKTGDVTFELPVKYSKGVISNALKDRITRNNFDERIENVHFVHKGKYVGNCTLHDIVNGDVPY